MLVEGRAVATRDVLQAERDVIADRFRGSRPPYLAALAAARVTPALAHSILGDELRRHAVEAGLRVPAPTTAQSKAWFDTYGGDERPRRSCRPARRLACERRSGIALAQDAPGRLFALPPGGRATLHGARVTALGETAPLGSFPYAQAAPTVRRALLAQSRHSAFATWARRRQNQSLARLTCRHDQTPQPATVDLTTYAPFLAL